ncbi:MAG: hypothetical protein LUH56_05475, partial [Oscillospiraceae bacterium]|nr:hypothetical protein [Oscillospiraceae bacterium]
SRVYSIWICMNMDECIWNHVHLTNDAVMANHDWKGKLDMLNIVLLGLPKELPPQDEEHKLHRMLSALFTLGLTSNERIDILENEYSIPAVHEFGEELNTMCNLGQGVYERGIEKGAERLQKDHKATAVYLHSIGLDAKTIAEAVSETPEQIKEWLMETLS